MKTKFNLYERVAGLFVLTAIVGGVAATIGVAVKQGWFERKIKMQTTLTNADGVRVGTQVQIAGLRAGSVVAIELKSNSEVHVAFEISERFHDRVRQDSVVRAIRPFIIGEKVLDLTVGSEEKLKVAENTVLPSEPTADVMDLISGRTLAPYLATMGKMTENLRFIAEAILDPQRSKAIVKIFDELSPLVSNASFMTKEMAGLLRQVNDKKQLATAVNNLLLLTNEITKVIPDLLKDSPQLAHDLAKIAKNTAVLTDELQKAMPALQEIGPELPRASRRAIEALDETVVTLKALQKSFLLSGKIEDVRNEEAQREKSRQPASSGQDIKK